MPKDGEKLTRAEKRGGQYRSFLETVRRETLLEKEPTLRDDLDALLSEMGPYLEPDGMQKADRQKMQSFYERSIEILDSLEKYFAQIPEETRVGLPGYDVYETFRKALSKDIRAFGNALKDPEALEFDLVQILEDSRSEILTVDADTIRKNGGALSTRLHVTGAQEGYFTVHETFDYDAEFDAVCKDVVGGDEGKLGFVKMLLDVPEVPTGPSSQFRTAYEELLTHIPVGKNENEKSMAYIMAGVRDPGEVRNALRVALEEDVLSYLMETDERFADGIPEEEQDPIRIAFEEEKNKFIGLLTDEMIDKLVDAGGKVDRLAFARFNYKTAGMNPKAKIDKRNSAMTVIAECIGTQDSIVSSKNRKLRVGDQVYNGTFMETAPGEDPLKLNADSDMMDATLEDLEDSPELITDIAGIQITHYIGGNFDGHAYNFSYVFRKEGQEPQVSRKLARMKSFDNDFSFTENHQGKKERRMNSVPFENLMIIPESVANKIMMLDPEVLRALLVGFDLDVKEVELTLVRLNDVKRAIAEGKKHYRFADPGVLDPGYLRVMSEEEIRQLSFSGDLYTDKKLGRKAPNLFHRIGALFADNQTNELGRKQYEVLSKNAAEPFFRVRKAVPGMTAGYEGLEKPETAFHGPEEQKEQYRKLMEDAKSLDDSLRNLDWQLLTSGVNEKGEQVRLLNKGLEELKARGSAVVTALQAYLVGEQTYLSSLEQGSDAYQAAAAHYSAVKAYRDELAKISEDLTLLGDLAAQVRALEDKSWQRIGQIREANQRVDAEAQQKLKNRIERPVSLEEMEESIRYDKALNNKNRALIQAGKPTEPPYPDMSELVLEAIDIENRELYVRLAGDSAQKARGQEALLSPEERKALLGKLLAGQVLAYLLTEHPDAQVLSDGTYDYGALRDALEERLAAAPFWDQEIAARDAQIGEAAQSALHVTQIEEFIAQNGKEQLNEQQKKDLENIRTANRRMRFGEGKQGENLEWAAKVTSPEALLDLIPLKKEAEPEKTENNANPAPPTDTTAPPAPNTVNLATPPGFTEDLSDLTPEQIQMLFGDQYVPEDSAFAYKVLKDPVTGLVLYGGVPQPIGPHLTEDIMISGDLETLRRFRHEHGEELNEDEKKYLDARIHSAKEVISAEARSKRDLAWGEADESSWPQLDVRDGFIGFSNVRLSEAQNSDNGCWSCAYSLLLSSRNVHMTQEEIRAYRPPYKPDMAKEQKPAGNTAVRMNSDQVNNLFENGDLAMQVLPNTAMSQVVLNPMKDMPLTITGSEGTKEMTPEQQEMFKEYYISKMTLQMGDTIRNAILGDMSPVPALWNNHYVTITGIRGTTAEDLMIRVEDSARSKAGHSTRYLKLKDVIEESLYGKMREEGYVRATGLSLCWLKKLDVPEYEEGAAQQKEVFFPEAPDILKADQEGNIQRDIPLDHPVFSAAGNPATGQLSGKGISKIVNLEQEQDEEAIFGGKVGGFDPGVLNIGTQDTYYPDKVYRPGDPSLHQYAFAENEQNTAFLYNQFHHAREILTQYGETFSQAMATFDDALGTVCNFYLDEKHREEVANAINILKGLRTFLREEAEPGKPNYQLIEETRLFQYRADFRKMCISLDHMLHLGLDIEEIKFDTEAERRFHSGEAAIDLEPAAGYARMIHRAWEDLRALDLSGPTSGRDTSIDKLAQILAIEILRSEEEENSHPERRTEMDRNQLVEAKKNEILLSRAFRSMVSGEAYKDLVRAEDSYGLVNSYLEAREAFKAAGQESIAAYGMSSDLYWQKKGRLDSLYGELEDTGRGSFMGFGIIPRFRNTTAYDRAKAALGRLRTKGYGDKAAADVYQSVMDIREYLEGKERVRTRGFGKARWNTFMSALSEVMPRDEFEAYCAEVNRARGVERDPDSSDFVGPELFYKKYTPIGEIHRETVSRIQEGKATERDFARMVAILRVGERRVNGIPQYDENKTGYGRRNLRKETDRVLNDPQFRLFLDLTTPEERMQFMVSKEGMFGLSFYGEWLSQTLSEERQINHTAMNRSRMAPLTNVTETANRVNLNAKETLYAFLDQPRMSKEDTAQAYLTIAKMVVCRIVTEEQQGQRNTNLSGTIGTSPERIHSAAESLVRLPEFKNALKEMKLDKLTSVDIKRFVLTDHASRLKEEFDRQQLKIQAANAKKPQPQAGPRKEGPKPVKGGM